MKLLSTVPLCCRSSAFPKPLIRILWMTSSSMIYLYLPVFTCIIKNKNFFPLSPLTFLLLQFINALPISKFHYHPCKVHFEIVRKVSILSTSAINATHSIDSRLSSIVSDVCRSPVFPKLLVRNLDSHHGQLNKIKKSNKTIVNLKLILKILLVV